MTTSTTPQAVGFYVKGKCKECGKTRLAPVDSQDRKYVEELFREISDYYCGVGDHYVFDTSFLDGYEWDLDHIDPQDSAYQNYVKLLHHLRG